MPIANIDSDSDDDDEPPPLLGRGDPDANSSSSDDDDSDSSLPALVGRRGYGDGADDSSSDDDLPPLVGNSNNNNRGGGGGVNNNTTNNRAAAGIQGTASVSNNNNNSNRGKNNNRGGGSNNTNRNNNRGGGNNNRNRNNNTNRNNNSDSSSSSDGSLPELVARAAAVDDDDTSDDDSDIPSLAPRNRDASDSSSDNDSIPDLIGRNHYTYDSSDDDDDDEDAQEQARVRAERALQQQQQQERRRAERARQQQQQHQQQRRNQPNSNNNRSSNQPNSTNINNNEVSLVEQLIRVDFWAQWIEEAEATRVTDLKAKVQKMIGNSNNHRLQGMEKNDLVLEYAAAKSKNLGGLHSPGPVRRLPPSQCAHWERIQQESFSSDNPTPPNYKRELKHIFGVTLPPELTVQECKDLYIYKRIQAEQERDREKGLSAFEKQVRHVQEKTSAFRLRQMLRDNYHMETDFLDTHADLARGLVYAQQRQQLYAATVNDAVPEALPAKDPSPSGAWVLAPLFGGENGNNNNGRNSNSNAQQSFELTYAWAEGTTIRKSKVYTTVTASDMMLPSGADNVWVYYQVNGTKYAVDQWRCEVSDLRIPMYQNLPRATQLVTNGASHGLWMLVPEAAAAAITTNSRRNNRSNNNSRNSSKLIFYNGDHMDGLVTEQRVPSRSGVRLFQDVASGGVWVYVPSAANNRERRQQANTLTAGLWHISTAGEAVRASFNNSTGDDDEEEETEEMWLDPCLFASDSARAGVLVLGPTTSDQGNSSMLFHVTWNAEEECVASRQHRVDAKFENVQAILDDGAGGALLHYQKFKDQGWKLTRAVFGNFELVEKYKCPKNAKIVSTGQGAVWVLKKTGRGQNWGLQYLHETKSVEASSEKYAVNSILCGAFERENNA